MDTGVQGKWVCQWRGEIEIKGADGEGNGFSGFDWKEAEVGKRRMMSMKALSTGKGGAGGLQLTGVASKG